MIKENNVTLHRVCIELLVEEEKDPSIPSPGNGRKMTRSQSYKVIHAAKKRPCFPSLQPAWMPLFLFINLLSRSLSPDLHPTQWDGSGTYWHMRRRRCLGSFDLSGRGHSTSFQSGLLLSHLLLPLSRWLGWKQHPRPNGPPLPVPTSDRFSAMDRFP